MLNERRSGKRNFIKIMPSKAAKTVFFHAQERGKIIEWLSLSQVFDLSIDPNLCCISIIIKVMNKINYI